jgi:glucan 1,3-beta-glucosidase
VTNTIYIPPGSKVVAESYSVIMSSGSKFSNINSPVPVVQVGHAGDSGSVQWSDMIVSTQGAQPGGVLIEWNLKASSGSGMWDVHTGIGGLLGSNLQVGQCPTSQTTPRQLPRSLHVYAHHNLCFRCLSRERLALDRRPWPRQR